MSQNVNQSIRVDNIWTAASSYVTFNVTSADQVVKLTYTPTGADNRAFLNGFEIDGPDLGYQIGFPIPTHLDEHFEGTDKSATAVWHAPDGIESPKYNIYLGTTPTDLKSISLEQIDTEVTFSGKRRLGEGTNSGRGFTDSSKTLTRMIFIIGVSTLLMVKPRASAGCGTSVWHSLLSLEQKDMG